MRGERCFGNQSAFADPGFTHHKDAVAEAPARGIDRAPKLAQWLCATDQWGFMPR